MIDRRESDVQKERRMLSERDASRDCHFDETFLFTLRTFLSVVTLASNLHTQSKASTLIYSTT